MVFHLKMIEAQQALTYGYVGVVALTWVQNLESQLWPGFVLKLGRVPQQIPQQINASESCGDPRTVHVRQLGKALRQKVVPGQSIEAEQQVCDG
jgi:hypothetical protein